MIAIAQNPTDWKRKYTNLFHSFHRDFIDICAIMTDVDFVSRMSALGLTGIPRVSFSVSRSRGNSRL